MTNTEYRAKRAGDRKRRKKAICKRSLQVDHIVQVHEMVSGASTETEEDKKEK